jgi:hypothetical protein
MVIAKPEWFKRKDGGIFNYKIPWQGTVYMMATVAVLFIGMMLPQNILIELIVLIVFLFLIIDAQIATWDSLDERERIHASIALRNTSLGLIIFLVIAMVIASNLDITKGSLYRLIFLAVFSGAAIGIITRYKLQREN